MRRALIALFIFAVAAFAANIKLYLKDGGFHVVREYKVEGDRINYYSVERSQWEEIPLELVDLKRTESEVAERQSALSEEDQGGRGGREGHTRGARRSGQDPQDPGVYYVENNTVKPIKVAESKVHNNKGRTVLKSCRRYRW